ncbi:MAG TPA: DUF1501 domain-containing protein [Bacteroidia bacterium]|nr:DUF1501 domain-containing protein [Bacteroidia bacterium]HNT80396.1 DUF1501 domain-containing protein [Bacteroidia bacterium]
MKRRDFLKISGLTSASLLVPEFVKAGNLFTPGYSDNILVVIQLSGGNDGLNTVVPFNNDVYQKSRPSLALQKSDVITVGDQLGFHSNLKGLADLFEDGILSVVNNVGYPNPNRSHFRSMDIWHSGSSSDTYIKSGWIGRYLDSSCSSENCRPIRSIELNEALSLALKGDQNSGLAVKDPETFYKSSNEAFFQSLAINNVHTEHEDLAYLRKTFIDAKSSAQYIFEKASVKSYDHPYPNEDFGQKLKTIASLIKAGSETKVYYVSLSGFDTHAFQPNIQGSLLKKYDNAVSSFVSDLKKSGHMNRTCIFTFSEFGRRVSQNASRGTDHGTANNVFIISERNKSKGFSGGTPDLDNLDENGDIIFKTDFRQIYSALLEQWLGAKPDRILPKDLAKLDLFSS